MGESPKTRRLRIPALPRIAAPIAAPIAAGVVGAIVALVSVGLVSAGEQGCDAVRGRPTCGGYGLVMIVAITAVTMLLGSLLLKAAHVVDGSLISFFGVTLALIVLLAAFIDQVFSPWMLLILPVLAAVCFVASALLTTALENTRDEGNHGEEARAPADEEAEEESDEETVVLPRYAPEPNDRPEHP